MHSKNSNATESENGEEADEAKAEDGGTAKGVDTDDQNGDQRSVYLVFCVR